MQKRNTLLFGTAGTIYPLLRNACRPLCIMLAVMAVPSVGFMGATPAQAQDLDRALQTGAKARVNRSASLRSLTEAVAAASCRLDGGIDVQAAQDDIALSRAQFDSILDGLENGNPTLGMPGAETRARTLRALTAAKAIWEPIDTAAQTLASGGTGGEAGVISAGFKDLFDQTEVLAAIISGQYSDPVMLLQSDATVLNFAIRQRALAYRMSREMCELATGTGSGEALANLQQSSGQFEQTLFALRDGFPAAGVNPPPTEAVSSSLQATLDIWQAERGIFDAALAGQTPSSDDVIKAAGLSEALSVAMNNTITLYLVATPGQDDVYRVPLEAYAMGELNSWLSNPALIAAINEQNVEHADFVEEGIITLDLQWRAEAAAGGGPLIESLMTRPLSNWLLEKQIATAGFVTEVFVMDNKGLNVAQSVVTSDYWQGDEAKWQETYSVGPNTLHISEVEFDDSTGFYQSQASLSITDPATGEVIGAVTFGINIQNLM